MTHFNLWIICINAIIVSWNSSTQNSTFVCVCVCDRLQQLAASTGSPLVVIECKPQDVYEWKIWVDQHSSRSWYKPATWDEVEPLLEFLYEDYEIEGISELVVDTTTYVRLTTSLPSIPTSFLWILLIGPGMALEQFSRQIDCDEYYDRCAECYRMCVCYK